MRVKKWLKYWGPVALMMILMFIGSSELFSSERTSRFIGPFLRWFHPEISDAVIRNVQLAVRKTAHVVEYAILTVLVLRALRSNISAPEWRWRTAWLAVGIGAAYAVSDEWHQSFVISRGASPWDVLIDAVGAVFGMICFHLFFLWRNRKRDSP